MTDQVAQDAEEVDNNQQGIALQIERAAPQGADSTIGGAAGKGYMHEFTARPAPPGGEGHMSGVVNCLSELNDRTWAISDYAQLLTAERSNNQALFD